MNNIQSETLQSRAQEGSWIHMYNERCFLQVHWNSSSFNSNMSIISEDVKSLALPGTYHEKVVSLGSSLRKFSRLKHLDLSRNNITSLQVYTFCVYNIYIACSIKVSK